MFLNNLLGAVTSIIPSIGEIANISVRYEWICNIISAIIGFAGDVGLGIILFTVILKIITLAPDIWSRASMKKNALKMEAMKEDLEKLQKQYAKNKDLYQQKMMALYKKNGYSAFSACLPTIITLVFFFIVIGAFNSYSQVSERDIFAGMANAYNKSLATSAEDENSFIFKGEDGKYYIDYDNVFAAKNINDCFIGENNDYKIDITKAARLIEIYGEDVKKIINEDGTINSEYPEFKYILQDEVKKVLIKEAIDGGLKDELFAAGALEEITEGVITVKDINVFWEKCEALRNKYSDCVSYTEENGYTTDFDKLISKDGFKEAKTAYETEANGKVTAEVFRIIEKAESENVKKDARKAAADWYESKENKARSVIFPWVKNIWASDCSWTTAIPKNSEALNQKIQMNINEADYNELTYDLGRYKETGFKNGNGWFILVALSILSMAGSTIIMNKTQKTQMQLSSVEGDASTAASTQKMMTWMMPIMFGVFSFIYSAAFSVYMVTNSLLSTGSTLLINFCVEKAFKKKIEKAEKEKIENHKYGKMR